MAENENNRRTYPPASSHLATLTASREELERAVAGLPTVVADLERRLALQAASNARLDALIARNEARAAARKGRSG